ncbi:unnamed protein product [Phytophthora fragariaefolia]|uniref:Unnamed protein product n=1 Tax=Phytophthora fragariaefolia TaxID=1490495 RepID=A0A9W6XW31_9STRA|nr:unnamed protein product [Phytophthora fragariaefolia]
MASGMSRDVNGVVSGTALHDSEQLYTLINGVTGDVDGDVNLGAVPTLAALLELGEMSFDEFGEALQAGESAEVVVILPEEELNASSLLDVAVLANAKKALNARSGSEILKNPSDPFYPVIREYQDVVSKVPPSGLPPDRGVRHEIDVVPGTKSCVTREWPLPREQCDAIDAFFRAKHEAGLTDVENHVEHLQAVLECMRTFKLYANIDKCIFGAEDIPFLGCVIGKRGLRADPAKVKAIVEWPVPRNQKALRKWLGLANYLHKYSENYAEMARPLSNLLKKDVEWHWNAEHQDAFEAIKDSLLHAPILAWPDPDRPFSVVCDASDFAIGCALLPADTEGRESVIAFESRQPKAAEKNYPVHDKGLLAMKYALVKFRVHLLGSKPFVNYTDHASLRTATQSPHLSQRMARWLSFFAEYNFEVRYKPGKQNALADALSRRPDYELAHVTTVTSSIPDLNRASYASAAVCFALLKALGSKEFEDSDKDLSARLRARLHRYAFDGALLYYSTRSDDPPRVVVPHNEDLKYRILCEAHDTPVGGHLGREKTYSSVSVRYWWPNLYKWVGTYVRTCETCQRVKPAPHAAAPLASLPVPSGCWQSISMDFVFGLPPDAAGNTGVVVFVDRLSKMAHLAAVLDTIDGEGPRFTGKFWTSIFVVLGTRLDMSTADHPQTDGQTERVNRVVENGLRIICAETPKRWSAMLPLVAFALNNAVRVSTHYTPLYVNGLSHPRVPLTPPRPGSGLSGGEEFAERLADISPLAVRKQVDTFFSTRLSALRHVRDAMAESQDKQKEHADAKGRSNVNCYQTLRTYLPMQCLPSLRRSCARASLDLSSDDQEGPSVYAQSS